MTRVRRIGILLFDDVEELDAVGPWEVLRMWTLLWPDDGWEVFTFSESPEPVTCAKGMKVLADCTEEDRAFLDVLVYPGGRGTRAQVHDSERLAWVRDRADSGTLMTSVCTGSLVYAAAGILRNRRATTHWASLDQLRGIDPTIEVTERDRYIDDGEVVTASGVSAGIDMALHLVARLSNVHRASQVRRAIQYDPEPPVPNGDPTTG